MKGLGYFVAFVFVAAAILVPIVIKQIARKRAEQRFRRGRAEGAFDHVPEGLHPIDRLGKTFSGVISVVCLLLAGFSFYFGASIINVGPDQVGHLTRKFGGTTMKEGEILATEAQNGKQLWILSPGWQLVSWINITHAIHYLDVVKIPAGKYGKLMSRAGKPLGDRAFAEAFDAVNQSKMINDAAFFIEQGGVKGPQTTVLTPGDHRINRYLWQVEEDIVTVIEKGTVGVVTSRVHGPVNFSDAFRFPKPETTKEIIRGGKDGQLKANLVSVGNIGVWDTAVPPGTYYINRDAFQVTPITARAVTWEFKGGFDERVIELTVAQDGKIEQKPNIQKHPQPVDAVDAAIPVLVEGHNIQQELRVVVQVTSENAPYVVAAVGDKLDDLENNIMTPIIRELVRNIIGGGKITVFEGGKEITRPVKVLDLINHREELAQQLETAIRTEGQKAGLDTMEVRLGYSAIPPEVTLARRIEQLALQLKDSFRQQEETQVQRIKAEKARAEADQQPKLVDAEIDVQRSERLMKAAENEGEGQKLKLAAIATGQRAQMEVLGQDRVVELQKFERLLEFYSEHPEVVTALTQGGGRLVPHTQIILGSGDGFGLEGAAAIFGALINNMGSSPAPAEAKAPAPRTGS